MLTIEEAFRKFKSRLELNEREQANASTRHQEVRKYINSRFAIERDFLTGSYARWTKTKPLKDVDIFFVLNDTESGYRAKAPSEVLADFYDILVEKYGAGWVTQQSRSINVNFGVVADAEDNTDYRILSVDVVPAINGEQCYEIPDRDLVAWIKTDPEIHAEQATFAHKAYDREWKGLVRMLKYWNNNPGHGEKPIKPSFLIEVMALQCLYGGWGGSFEREMQSIFATFANRIFDEWVDPAGLGPAVSNSMDKARKTRAQQILKTAERISALAINHSRNGRNGEALRTWRDLFGPKFPLT